MGSILKYLVIALFIVLAGAWLFTVAESCNTSKNDNTSITNNGSNADNANESAGEGATDSDLEDLYEVDESDVRDGNADRSAAGEEELPSNAEAGDDLELGDANAPDEDPLAERGDESSTVSTGSSTFGKYLVVTGSYLSEANAKIMADQLRDYGYNAAEVLTFDLSQYYSVTTGRYNNLAEARTAARQVKQKGVEAYVHKMRGKKMER